jgi:hypothetical protein
MKCISCEIEINPQWTHAIDINVCPFCGKHIMEEHLKNLFTTLRETMVSLQAYPDQVNDWLLSNYNYIKTDSPNIGKFMPPELLKELKKVEDNKDFLQRKESNKFTVKVQTETGEEEVQAEKIQSEERTNDFFKRAEVIKTNPNPGGPSKQQQGPNVYQSPAEKTEHLKKVAQQIKKAGSQGINAGGGSFGIPAEMLEQADPEAVAEFQSMISGGEVASSLDSDGIDDDLPGGDFILQANMAAAAGKGGGGGSGGQANAKDLAHLQRLQAKVSQARHNVQSGSKGSFSRS